jgi:hypothetical protein
MFENIHDFHDLHDIKYLSAISKHFFTKIFLAKNIYLFFKKITGLSVYIYIKTVCDDRRRYKNSY